MGRTITIEPEVENVLRACRVEGSSLFLPEKLDPKLYRQVNKALEIGGGKWSRKLKAHVFEGDPMTKLGLALEAGHIVDDRVNEKKERQEYYTPPDVGERMAKLADVRGKWVLEPSSGHAALALACRAAGAQKVMCIEQYPPSVEVCRGLGFETEQADFLSVNPADYPAFSRIVMNPPYWKQMDVKHVAHALKFLAPGGAITALMYPDTDRTSFNKLINTLVWKVVEELPPGAFKESGTAIRPLMIQFRQPGAPG